MIQPIKDDYPTANLTSKWKIKIIYKNRKEDQVTKSQLKDLKRMKP